MIFEAFTHNAVIKKAYEGGKAGPDALRKLSEDDT